jgi:hypothetical protein
MAPDTYAFEWEEDEGSEPPYGSILLSTPHTKRRNHLSPLLRFLPTLSDVAAGEVGEPEAMAAHATLPFSCSSKLQTLSRTLSPRGPLHLRRSFLHLLSLAASPRFSRAPLPSCRHIAASSESSNGASAEGEYDFDLFTIGAGSGGVRASRFASTLHGARVAICEMPYATIASEEHGGLGGT